MTIRNFFLRASSWKIFVLIFLVPFMAQMIAVFTVLPSFLVFSRDPDPVLFFRLFEGLFLFSIVVQAYNTFMLFGWLYSVGTGLHAKLPPEVAMPVTRFKFLLFITAGYILLILAALLILLLVVFEGLSLEGWETFPVMVFPILAPFHFLSILGALYSVRFVAKVLKSAEWQKEAHIGDYFGELFGVLFWPIGIWFLQPRINALADQEPEISTTSGDPFLGE